MFIIDRVDSESKAQESGFERGDKIVGIEGIDLRMYSTWNELRGRLLAEQGKQYKIEVERWNRKERMRAAPEDFSGARIYSEREYRRSFANKSLLDRFMVVIAGPFMNLAFPFLVMPLVFMIGITIPKYLQESPVIGYVAPNSPAAEAGFEPGDVITEIEGNEVSNWREVNIQFGTNPGTTIAVNVERDSASKKIYVTTPEMPGTVESVGIALPLKAKVGSVMQGTPAEKAGLKKGDEIVSIDGTPVENWYQMASIIQKSEGKEISLELERDSSAYRINLTPKPLHEEGKGAIGITPWREEITKKYGFVESILEGLAAAAKLIVDITFLLVGFILKLITGEISLSTAGKTIAGPIAIAQFSGSAAEGGLASLLQFTVFISINLGIINLFPIPMLDGGHVIYLAVEAVRRRPLSLKTLEIAQRAGFAFLMFIMFLAVYNDISRLRILDRIHELFK